MVSHRSKIAAIISLIIFVGIIFITSQRYPFSPYDFGFFADGFQQSAVKSSVNRYSTEMHERSLSFIVSRQILSEVTGLGYSILVKLPLAGIIGIMIYAILDDLPTELRSIGTMAAIGGPVTLIGFYYNFRRDGFDLILILLVILILNIERNRKRGRIPMVFTAIIVSTIVWKLHYTAWPFLATMIFTLFVVKYIRTKEVNNLYVSLGTILPMGIDATPLSVYIGYIPYILNLNYERIKDVFSLAFGGRSISPPAGSIKIADSSPKSLVSWMPEAQYLTMFVLIILLVLLWTLSFVYSPSIKRYIRPDTHIDERDQFFAITVATFITMILFIIASYPLRIRMFFPIAFAIFIREIWLRFEIIPNKLPVKKVFAGILLLLLVAYLIPIAATDYINADGRAVYVEDQQIKSSEWSSYLPSQKTVNTDLTHANHIVISSGHQNIVVGTAFVRNDGLLIDTTIQDLFKRQDLESYILVTEKGTVGTVVWGGVIPTASPEKTSGRVNRIYTNEMDSWYFGVRD